MLSISSVLNSLKTKPFVVFFARLLLLAVVKIIGPRAFVVLKNSYLIDSLGLAELVNLGTNYAVDVGGGRR